MKKGFLSIKFNGNAQRGKIEALTGVFAQMGIELYCFVRDEERWGEKKFTAKEMMDRAFAQILRSDVMIVEFTEKGVGVGIEAGYAAARGIPVIVIAPPEADISMTLQGIMRGRICYEQPEDLAGEREKFEKWLQ